MADDKERKDGAMPENSKEGEAIDTILKHLDSLHKRLDALESKAKKDAEEPKEEKKEDAEKEAKAEREDSSKEEGEKEAEGKEASEEREDRKDKKRKDAKRKDEDEDEDEKEKREDAVRKDSQNSEVTTLRQQIADLEKRLPVELKEEDRQAFVDVQVRHDSVSQMFGQVTPRWQTGESLLQYRRRLLRKVQDHSPAWKGVDISKINDSAALDNIERQVLADAEHVAKHPVNDGKGTLRAVVTTDSAGRKITKFYGDASVTWGPFQPQVRRNIVGFNRDSGNRS